MMNVWRLYFAYSSNLNVEQMLRRCPTAAPFSRARLHGYRLECRRVLTIVPHPGSYVDGALWVTQPSDELALDRYEGFDRHRSHSGLCRKENVAVEVTAPPAGLEDLTGVEVLSYVYIMNRGAIAPPSPSYLATCSKGAKAWGIPVEAIEGPAREAGEQ